MDNLNWAVLKGPSQKMLCKIPNETVDLTVTSPPYDAVRDYELLDRKTFRKIAKELFRVTKSGGVVVWIVADQTKDGTESGTSFEQWLFFKNVCGFKMHDTMIYKRSNPPLTHKRYEQGFEYMFVMVKGNKGPKTFNGLRENKEYPEKKPRKKAYHRETNGTHKIGTYKADDGTKLKDNVWWYGKNITQDKFAFKHPAIFPEALALDHIFSWSDPDDVVLDPFCGSGTTMKMALAAGRRAIGIEVNPEYVEIIKRRISSNRDSRCEV